MTLLIAHIALKAKIVRQESLAIDANFEKKRKQADTALKMCVFQSAQILSCADPASHSFDVR
jgi:hypothetical protein